MIILMVMNYITFLSNFIFYSTEFVSERLGQTKILDPKILGHNNLGMNQIIGKIYAA